MAAARARSARSSPTRLAFSIEPSGRTSGSVQLAAVAWTEPQLRELDPMEQAKRAGEILAGRAKEAGVANCVFDRGGYQYHGRVRALAEGAREGGLRF